MRIAERKHPWKFCVFMAFMALLAPHSNGPPYILNEAQLGGLPTAAVDVPASSVFLLLFAASAAASTVLLARRIRALRADSNGGTRARFSAAAVWALTFLFSSERVLACALRIAWARRVAAVRVALVAQVFVHAGVLLLYLLTVLLAKRVLWQDAGAAGAALHRRLRPCFAAMVALTVSALAMLVAAMVVSVYTRDAAVRARCRSAQRAGAAYFLVFAAVPLLVLGLAGGARHRAAPGGWEDGARAPRRVGIVVLASGLCLLNAGFKAGVMLSPARPLLDPAWYHAPACLYAFFFGTELLVLLLFYVTRIDVVFGTDGRRSGELDLDLTDLVLEQDNVGVESAPSSTITPK